MAPKRKKSSVKHKAKTKTKGKAKAKKKGKKQKSKKVSKPKRKSSSHSRKHTAKKSKAKQKSRILHKKYKQTKKRDSKGRFVSARIPHKHKVLALKKRVKRLVTKKRPKRIRVEPQKTLRHYQVPFFDVPQGSSEGYTEGLDNAPESYMTASKANRKSPDFALPEAFESAFIAALRKGPFEADEVLIYRFGIIIRPRKGTFATEDKQFIANILKDIPGSSVHHVKENETFSLRINLGSPIKGELAGTVSDEINKYKHLLAEIYENVISEFGLTEWFSFWDTEEAMYE